MVEQTYTHRDLAGLLGVSETTVKSYRTKFPAFLPVAREGKPLRLHPEALDVCRRIRDLFADGLSIAQTEKILHAEFKEYPHNRRLSTANKLAASGGLDSGLLSRLEALTQAHELSRQRMGELEAEVRNLAALEASSKTLIIQLLQEFRTARKNQPTAPPAPQLAQPQAAGQAEPAGPLRPAEPAEPSAAAGSTVVTARKIVTVHGQTGALASYALAREARPEPVFAPPAQPEPDFLELPAVIRSDRGEFLGLPGGQSIARLLELLTPADGEPVSWFAEGPEVWTCEAAVSPALTRELCFERTTTPRGNRVGLILRLRTLSGAEAEEATPAELQDFFRLLRDQMGQL